MTISSLNDWRPITTSQVQLEASDAWTYSDNDWMMPLTVSMASAESDEFNLLWADIQTYIQEYSFRVIMGEDSLDTHDSFIAQLKQYNIDRCIELKQNALNRYNAR